SCGRRRSGAAECGNTSAGQRHSRDSAPPGRPTIMHVIRRRGWEIPERLATPEHIFLNRRAFIGAAAGVAALTALPRVARAQRIADLPDPTADLYPAKRNEAYKLDRPITPAEINGNYNNFYEFGPSKSIAKA